MSRVMFVFFFFNATATPEIYTYGHPLSLHDALPICVQGPFAARAALMYTIVNGMARRLYAPDEVRFVLVGDARVYLEPATARGLRRSEEHTSELQSLMRISYAVFCLKKKTIYMIENDNQPVYSSLTTMQH